MSEVGLESLNERQAIIAQQLAILMALCAKGFLTEEDLEVQVLAIVKKHGQDAAEACRALLLEKMKMEYELEGEADA